MCVQDEDEDASLADLLATPRGQATVASELVALVAILPFLVGCWGLEGTPHQREGREDGRACRCALPPTMLCV